MKINPQETRWGGTNASTTYVKATIVSNQDKKSILQIHKTLEDVGHDHEMNDEARLDSFWTVGPSGTPVFFHTTIVHKKYHNI